MPAPNKPAIVPDERQRQAIEHVEGPMLVVAGAGTGKTTVLIQRIARLIRQEGVRPDQILALTYTDNSAREMSDRVRAELRGVDLSGLQTKTFHAYCNELLIRHGRGFGVLEDTDLWIYLRRRIHELNLRYFVRAANTSQFLHDLLDFMRRCQDELVTPEKYAEYVRQVGCGELGAPRVSKSKAVEDLSREDIHGRCEEISRIFATVEKLLLDLNLGTFGHMITRAHDLLTSEPEILARERLNTRFILVDEFQDANFAQVRILQKLASDERNVFAVGDPDQAIYRFRGASSAAFELFQRAFEGAKLAVLEKNRRSTSPILQAAFSIITRNPEVFSPSKDGAALAYRRSPLKSAREEEASQSGSPMASVPIDIAFTDKDMECADVVDTIVQRKKQLRAAWRDFAVLYRLHSHRKEIVEELSARGIPFSIENMDVMDTSEVRDLLACAGATLDRRDSASLFRVVALPQFKIDPDKLRAGIRAIPRDARDAGIASVLESMDEGRAVLELLEQTREEVLRTNAKARGALEIILRRFGIDRTAPPVDALLRFASRWEEKPITKKGVLGEFMEYQADFRDAGGAVVMPSIEENSVTLVSAHGAKGLEFGHVFILRVRSPSFPYSYREPLFEFPQDLRDPDSVGQGDDKTLHDQEERRLFYVAMTRARDSLTLYGRQSTGKDRSPAVYIREMAKNTALRGALRQRNALGFQTEIFASAAGPLPTSRIADWLEMAPASDLGARLSASAVSSYEKCPLQFKLEREWRLPTEVPAAMQYGATIHQVLRTFYDSVRFQRTLSDEAVIALFRSTLTEARIQDPYQHELYERQGVTQLQDFLAAARELPPFEVLHTEEWFEIPVEQTVVTGRIDRMDRAPDGTIVITDYKTGKAQTQEDADESLQLSIYALAAREKWGYAADRLVLHNLEDNSPVTTRRSSAELEEAKNRVKKVAESIRAGEYAPKAGFHCGFCPYFNLCPATERHIYNKVAGKAASRN